MSTLTRYTYMDRVVADSADRETWLTARAPGLGGSDAAGFSKLESAPRYAAAKISPSKWTGNVYTRFGSQWEAAALAAVGLTNNTLMFHHPEHHLFFTTPDGIEEEPGGLILSEAKATANWKGRIPTDHYRQMQWNIDGMGADGCRYVVLPYDKNTMTPTVLTPLVIEVDRDPATIAKLHQIGHQVLAIMAAAAAFERTLVL